MERMGHSTINVTLGTYGHMFPAIDEQLDEALALRYRRSSQVDQVRLHGFDPQRSGITVAAEPCT